MTTVNDVGLEIASCEHKNSSGVDETEWQEGGESSSLSGVEDMDGTVVEGSCVISVV